MSGRTRRLLRSIGSSLVGRAVGIISPLVAVPFCLTYMGPERYGVWMSATSLTSMALFADFGIGNGLLTKLSIAHAREDHELARRLVSSAYLTVMGIAATLIAVAAVACATVDWASAFGQIGKGVSAEVGALVFICFSAFALNIPAALVQRVQYSQQQFVQSNAWQAAGALISVSAIAVAIAARLPPLGVVAVSAFSLPAINACNSLLYFGVQNPRLRPHPRCVSREAIRAVSGTGIGFFVISVLTSVSLNSDTFIVSRIIGPAAAAEFSVTSKLFTVLSLCVTLVGLALWPSNSNALAKGDLSWVRRTTSRVSLASGILVLVVGIPLALFSDRIISAWIGNGALPRTPKVLALSFLLWAFVLALASPYFAVQNSWGILLPQIIGWAAYLPISILAKVETVKILGLAGVPLGGVVSYAFVIIPLAYWGYKTTLETAQRASISEHRSRETEDGTRRQRMQPGRAAINMGGTIQRVVAMAAYKFPHGDAMSNRLLHLVRSASYGRTAPLVINFWPADGSAPQGSTAHADVEIVTVISERGGRSRRALYRAWRPFRLIVEIRRAGIRREEIAIFVLPQNLVTMSCLLVVRGLLRCPVVVDVTERHDRKQFNSVFDGFYLRHLWTRFLTWMCAQRVTSVSTVAAKRLTTTGRTVAVVPPQVSCEEMSKSEAAPPSRTLKLLYAGNPGKKDLLDVVFKGLTQLSQEYINRIELTVAGLTAEQALASSFVSRRELDALGTTVHFLGRVSRENVLAQLRESHFSILIRPSGGYAAAGFPSKVPESFAVGCPMLLTLQGDLGMYITDGVEGLVVERPESESIAQTLTRACNLSDQEWQTMSAAARKRAEENFDYRNFLNIPVFRQIVKVG